MAQQAVINPYIVKFLKNSNPPKNKIAGTGFLIAPNHVVTCTHVLWAALGKANNSNIQKPIPSEDKFDAEFPLLLPQPVTVTLKIIRSNGWNKQADVTSIDDITVLEILGSEFKGHTPCMKALQDEAHRGHLFFAKGFHDSKAEELDGICESGIGDGRIALRITSKPTYLGGASGGPVWDKQENAIIGMLQSANAKSDNPAKHEEAKSDRAYMIPLSKIQQFCEGLDIFPKSLSTDPIKNQRIPEENGNFKAVLAKKIIRELRHPDAQLLKEALAEELDINEETDKKALLILANELLNRDVDEAIRDYLTVATTDCIHEDGYRFQEASDKTAVIKKIAEEILGWLVLSSVDDNTIGHIFPTRLDSDSLYFALGINTLGGVELVLSRRFQRKSDWLGKESGSQGSPHYIAIDPGLFSPNTKESTRILLLKIWNRVFDTLDEHKNESEALTKEQIHQLNATLRNRREKKKDTEHYYCVFHSSENTPEAAETTYRELLSSDMLHEMTVVELGSKDATKILLLEEYRVIAAINDFYRDINKHARIQEQQST